MKRNLFPASLIAALVLSATGCMSVPEPSEIPMETTAIELSQKGQEAIDASNNKAAEVYYQVLIDRYGTDTSKRVAAEYEIAHIRVKQKAWDDARTRLQAIISRYDEAGGTTLPPEYLVLAKNDLERVEKATAPKAKSTTK